MFDHKHYVPILKGKEGEYSALDSLAPGAKGALTPLIEVPPIPWDFVTESPAKSVDAHVENVAARIERCWGGERPLFVDLLWIPQSESMADGRHPLSYVLDDGRSRGLRLIPVTGLSRDDEYQGAVRDAAAQDGLGICIRLENDDFEDISALAGELNQFTASFELTQGDIDLVIDFKEVSAGQTNPTVLAVRSIINSLPSLNDWRSLTLAASAFPENMSQVSRGVTRTQRAEWIIWEALANSQTTIGRLPTFGDYAINHPEPSEVDPRIMQMSASLRYTTDREWLIFKGRAVRLFGYEQFNDLCRALVGRSEYSGVDFSWGDGYVAGCADNTEGPGNAMVWRRVGTSHHLTFVTDQIANFSGL